MAEGAIAAMAVGATISLIGAEQARQDQEDAAKAQAKLKRAQATELLERFEINSKSLERLGQETKAAQQAAYGRGGVDVGTGAPLLMMEDTYSKIQRQINLEKREAEFKAKQLIRGADIEAELAGDISSAQKLENIGVFLTGAAKTGITAMGGK